MTESLGSLLKKLICREGTQKTNELEYFEEYFTLEIWKELTHYTNLNAEKKKIMVTKENGRLFQSRK